MTTNSESKRERHGWSRIIRGTGLICTCAAIGLTLCSSSIAQSNNSGDPDTDEEAQGGYITALLDKYDIAITKSLTGSGTIYENDGDVDSEDPITATADNTATPFSGTGTVGFSIPTYIDGDITVDSASADASDQRVTGHVHKPSGELLRNDGWRGQMLLVGSTLLPTTIDFSGITVAESTGTGSHDSCYYTGATGETPYDKLAGGTGGGSTFPVGANNDMGDDGIGWGTFDIQYYRSHGRATCGTIIAQNMSVVVPSPHPNVQYTNHTIKLYIGKAVLTNIKDTVTSTENY